jgi:MoaA/NifB/PqqE/SkfB family radical SAM enzyme
MNKSLTLTVDVAAKCNLNCPSCPQAGGAGAKSERLLGPELLHKFIKKALNESDIEFVYLYNWAEPFLNPTLPELIEVVNTYKLPCGISSNLNIRRNIDRVMTANPANFVISASGFTQSVYGVTHSGGNIERVKENMALVAEAKKAANSTTRVEVNYIRYLGNLDEMVMMRQFADSLGFAFRLTIAALFPLEKLLAYLTDPVERSRMELDEGSLLNRLIFPYDELLEYSEKFKRFDCAFLEDQVVLDSKGAVQQCPLVYDPNRFTICDYLSTPLEAIQAMKRKTEICRTCRSKGIHTLGLRFGPDLKPAVLRRIAKYYTDAGVDFRNLTYSRPKHQINQTIRLIKEHARNAPGVRSFCKRLIGKFPVLAKLPGDLFSLE